MIGMDPRCRGILNKLLGSKSTNLKQVLYTYDNDLRNYVQHYHRDYRIGFIQAAL